MKKESCRISGGSTKGNGQKYADISKQFEERNLNNNKAKVGEKIIGSSVVNMKYERSSAQENILEFSLCWKIIDHGGKQKGSQNRATCNSRPLHSDRRTRRHVTCLIKSCGRE